MGKFSELFWQYKGLIEFMEKHPGTYGLDNQRSVLHKEMECHFVGKEDVLKEVLHNLPVNFTPSDVEWAVNDLDAFRDFIKVGRTER